MSTTQNVIIVIFLSYINYLLKKWFITEENVNKNKKCKLFFIYLSVVWKLIKFNERSKKKKKLLLVF